MESDCQYSADSSSPLVHHPSVLHLAQRRVVGRQIVFLLPEHATDQITAVQQLASVLLHVAARHDEDRTRFQRVAVLQVVDQLVPYIGDRAARALWIVRGPE